MQQFTHRIQMAEVMNVIIMLTSCLRHVQSTLRQVIFQQKNIVISVETQAQKRSATGESLFADLTNQHLEKAGYDVRVDHRSYKDQKNGLEATKHEGYEVTQLRRMGVETEISVSNDLIKQNNFERTQDPQLLKGLEQEIFASEK